MEQKYTNTNTHRRKCEDNINMDLTKILCGRTAFNWLRVSKISGYAKALINLQILQTAGNSLTR
jgi:hypothetical protein